MQQKCDTNIELAQKLINKKYYTNSVHCSYYGCLQYLKYILNEKNICSYEIQNSGNRDSHNFILLKLSDNIKNPKVLRDIRSCFESLKNKRRRADYYEDIFEAEESLTAIDEAKGIIYKVKNAFGGS